MQSKWLPLSQKFWKLFRYLCRTLSFNNFSSVCFSILPYVINKFNFVGYGFCFNFFPSFITFFDFLFYRKKRLCTFLYFFLGHRNCPLNSSASSVRFIVWSTVENYRNFCRAGILYSKLHMLRKTLPRLPV